MRETYRIPGQAPATAAEASRLRQSGGAPVSLQWDGWHAADADGFQTQQADSILAGGAVPEAMGRIL